MLPPHTTTSSSSQRPSVHGHACCACGGALGGRAHGTASCWPQARQSHGDTAAAASPSPVQASPCAHACCAAAVHVHHVRKMRRHTRVCQRCDLAHAALCPPSPGCETPLPAAQRQQHGPCARRCGAAPLPASTTTRAAAYLLLMYTRCCCAPCCCATGGVPRRTYCACLLRPLAVGPAAAAHMGRSAPSTRYRHKRTQAAGRTCHITWGCACPRVLPCCRWCARRGQSGVHGGRWRPFRGP